MKIHKIFKLKNIDIKNYNIFLYFDNFIYLEDFGNIIVKKMLLLNNGLSEINRINIRVKELNLYKNNIKKIENISETVEVLDLRRNYIEVIENLPEKLKILRISGNPLKKIKRSDYDLINKNRVLVDVNIENLEIID